jgi:flagellar hook-associated protein 2
MGLDIFAAGNSSIDRLIETILQLEARPRFILEDKKDQLESRRTVLSELDSRLSKLESVSERLTDSLTDYFAAKNASSSDEDKFSIAAGSDAIAGTHDVTISRLASSDTRVSKQYTGTGTDLKTFFDTNGSQTFQIEIAHPTDDDSSNRETIEVTVNQTGSDDDSIMDEIALAINDAMDSAVTAETIDSDEKLSASVVHEEDGTSRLVFRSGQPGYTYRMDMTDSTNSLLSTMEISAAVASSGTSGGYITAVGTSASDSSLNAQLLVDGLTFYRDANSITDLLDGVTMTIKDVTETTESFQVTEDVEAVKTEVEEFLNAYNSVIRFLREKSKVDAETGDRGALAGESTYSFLRSNLRSLFTSTISSVESGNPQNLFEIGITSSSDGTLSISDADEFETILATGSSKISDLFNTTTGVATQVATFIEDFVKTGGIIDDSGDAISERIKSLDSQMARFDDRLGRREAQLRQQFAKMQETSLLLGRQQSTFASIASTIRF